jgi:tRNA nucleotidyltransferase (CCA-adding enzyme)
MTNPIVVHRDIVDFADDKVNLHRDKVKKYREQVQSLRTKLDTHIASHPGYELVKMLNAGSVAKGTALSRLHDMDVAVYVKKGSAPENEILLLRWLTDRLRAAYPGLAAEQFSSQQHCVTVSFRGTGLDVDVVPVLYENGDDDRGCLIAKDSGDRLETSVTLHRQFIQRRRRLYGAQFAEYIRLVKWWVDTTKRSDPNSGFKFKSFLVELLCAHLVDQGLAKLESYPLALEQFFGYIVNTGLREQIVFSDYYGASEVASRSADAIQVYDPVNPTNNVARRYGIAQRDSIVRAAQDAFDALTEAHYATTQGRAYECWRDVFGPSFGR